jgi:KDEL-tailed cysteine endopeptidase
VTAATIESLNKIKTGNLVSLSEQELIDCDTYDSGCSLGHFTTGYRWVIQNGGMAASVDYPYQGFRGYCNSGIASNHVASISNYVQISGEDALLSAVAQQPVAAGIFMGGDLQYYTGGVFSGQCGWLENHGVTVVGYGADASTGLKYWIIKNSWGTGWGEMGFARLQRDVGGGGICGIAADLAYPVM